MQEQDTKAGIYEGSGSLSMLESAGTGNTLQEVCARVRQVCSGGDVNDASAPLADPGKDCLFFLLLRRADQHHLVGVRVSVSVG